MAQNKSKEQQALKDFQKIMKGLENNTIEILEQSEVIKKYKDQITNAQFEIINELIRANEEVMLNINAKAHYNRDEILNKLRKEKLIIEEEKKSVFDKFADLIDEESSIDLNDLKGTKKADSVMKEKEKMYTKVNSERQKKQIDESEQREEETEGRKALLDHVEGIHQILKREGGGSGSRVSKAKDEGSGVLGAITSAFALSGPVVTALKAIAVTTAGGVGAYVGSKLEERLQSVFDFGSKKMSLGEQFYDGVKAIEKDIEDNMYSFIEKSVMVAGKIGSKASKFATGGIFGLDILEIMGGEKGFAKVKESITSVFDWYKKSKDSVQDYALDSKKDSFRRSELDKDLVNMRDLTNVLGFGGIQFKNENRKSYDISSKILEDENTVNALKVLSNTGAVITETTLGKHAKGEFSHETGFKADVRTYDKNIKEMGEMARGFKESDISATYEFNFGDKDQFDRAMELKRQGYRVQAVVPITGDKKFDNNRLQHAKNLFGSARFFTGKDISTFGEHWDLDFARDFKNRRRADFAKRVRESRHQNISLKETKDASFSSEAIPQYDEHQKADQYRSMMNVNNEPNMTPVINNITTPTTNTTNNTTINNIGTRTNLKK